MSLPPDLIDLLAEFAAAGVDYLLVGGHAVAIHGHPRFTKDADLWLRDDPPNLEKVSAALARFGAPPQVARSLVEAAREDVVWMGAPPARVDLLKWVPGGDFAASFARKLTLAFEGLDVNVIAKDDLVAIKRASGRSRDLEDVRALTGDTDA